MCPIVSRRHFVPLNSSALVLSADRKESAVSYEFVKRKLDRGRSILPGTRRENKKKWEQKRRSLISKSAVKNSGRSRFFKIVNQSLSFSETKKDVKVMFVERRYSGEI